MEYIILGLFVWGVVKVFSGGKSGSSSSSGAMTQFEKELYSKMSNRDPNCNYCGKNGISPGAQCPRTCAEVRHIYKKHGKW